MTFKEWKLECSECGLIEKRLMWDTDLPAECPTTTCGRAMWPYYEPKGKAPGVIGDDIPGGVVIRHLGPTPQKFYSKTEIKRACNEGGWSHDGDTPKPYKVNWSGKTNSPAK